MPVMRELPTLGFEISISHPPRIKSVSWCMIGEQDAYLAVQCSVLLRYCKADGTSQVFSGNVAQ
jgi:hypothetical protein